MLDKEVRTFLAKWSGSKEPVVKAVVEALTEGDRSWYAVQRNGYDGRPFERSSRDWESIGEWALWGTLVGVSCAGEEAFESSLYYELVHLLRRDGIGSATLAATDAVFEEQFKEVK